MRTHLPQIVGEFVEGFENGRPTSFVRKELLEIQSDEDFEAGVHLLAVLSVALVAASQLQHSVVLGLEVDRGAFFWLERCRGDGQLLVADRKLRSLLDAGLNVSEIVVLVDHQLDLGDLRCGVDE